MSGNDSGITFGNQYSLEQYNVEITVSFNEANTCSTFETGYIGNISCNLNSFSKHLNNDKQGKHIPRHKNFQLGKSELTVSMFEASELVEKFSGTGDAIGSNKERVDFGKIIGTYKDPSSEIAIPTTIGIIHYSKNGTHIVPARPKEL